MNIKNNVMKNNLLLVVLLSLSLTESKSQSLMTVQEIYNYDIGDIFDFKVEGYYSPPTYSRTIITNKYFSSALDTVFYVADVYSYTPPGCPTCSAVYDTSLAGTFFYTNLNDTVGTGLGTKPHYWSWDCIDTAGYTGTWVDTIYFDSTFCNRRTVIISSMGNGPQLMDSCYSYFEPFYGSDGYGEGIGLRGYYYDACSMGFPNCKEVGELLYYKKGMDSCGTAPIIPIPLSVAELKFANSFKIFPNPFSFETHLTFFEEQRNSVIIVTNILGEEVKKIIFNGTLLTLEKGELKNGVYFVHVGDIRNIYSAKLIIQ
jgi:hypothetical protein